MLLSCDPHNVSFITYYYAYPWTCLYVNIIHYSKCFLRHEDVKVITCTFKIHFVNHIRTCTYILAEREITIWNWSAVPQKQEHCNRLSMASPWEMYSKFGLANWICWAKWGKLVGKWPMAECYFKFCISVTPLQVWLCLIKKYLQSHSTWRWADTLEAATIFNWWINVI